MTKFGPYLYTDDKGVLHIEGVSTTELAEQYGTPLFVFSENTLRDNFRTIREAFERHYAGETIVCAGMKANWGLATRAIIAQEGGGGDAFGVGELSVASMAGTDLNKVVMNGANKSEEAITAAIDSSVLINVDNLDELDDVNRIAEELGKKARITIRIRLPLNNCETGELFFDPRYPAGISPQYWERTFKFGLEPQSFFIAVERALAHQDTLSLEGVMYHGGLPRRAGKYFEETQELIETIAEVWKRYKFELKYLDIGGGFVPARYGAENTPPTPDDYAIAINKAIVPVCEQNGIKPPILLIEPGRFCFDSACIWLSRVGNIKEDRNLADKKWVFVDGNTNDTKDPFDPYNRVRHIVIANDADRAGSDHVDICGQLCSADDIVTKDCDFLPPLKSGDLLAYLDMGAYNESYSCQANANNRSATVMVKGDRSAVVRRRETVADVLSRELLPSWLIDNRVSSKKEA